ncbi:MAG TPA: efflux RND transporter periplasmic adaptor subunit [Chthoniobacteraceae bacterium]|nr:efflux RND transporter periplasmic adaptor subunit [Chthoniobacteraceae bacterium]
MASTTFAPPHASRSTPLARLAARTGLALGAAAVLALGGCKKPEVENPLLMPPEVEVAQVTRGDVPVFREWIGVVDGSNNAEIRARVSGYILSQNYADGSPVKKGDLLFEIDPRPFEASLAAAEASLAEAEAEQVRAQLNADKYTQTFETGAVSKKDRDNTVQQNEAAKAKVKAEQASVEQAKLNLLFTKVTAPLDGIISIATRNIGDLVGPTDPTPLATLSTVDPVRVYFQVSEQTYLKASERFSGHVKEAAGQFPVKMILADGSVYPRDGRFVAVDREVQGSTGTIRIAVEFPNPGNRLRPGQFARVRIAVHVVKDALLVPQQALDELQGSYQVAVLNPDNTVSIRVVKPGPRFGPDWVVLEGLKPEEKVVVEGIQKVAQGKTVVPKPYQAEKTAEPPTAPPAAPQPENGEAPGGPETAANR